MNKVNIGVSELSIPAMELSMRVWAFVNKNAGMKLPINPAISKLFRSLRLSCLMCRSDKGSNANEALTMRMAAACGLVKLLRPIFIKMNELPHTKASKISVAYCPQRFSRYMDYLNLKFEVNYF